MVAGWRSSSSVALVMSDPDAWESMLVVVMSDVHIAGLRSSGLNTMPQTASLQFEDFSGYDASVPLQASKVW